MDASVVLVWMAKRHKPLVGVSPQIYVALGRSSVLVTVSANDSRIVSLRNLHRASCSDDLHDDRCIPLRSPQ